MKTLFPPPNMEAPRHEIELSRSTLEIQLLTSMLIAQMNHFKNGRSQTDRQPSQKYRRNLASNLDNWLREPNFGPKKSRIFFFRERKALSKLRKVDEEEVSNFKANKEP